MLFEQNVASNVTRNQERKRVKQPKGLGTKMPTHNIRTHSSTPSQHEFHSQELIRTFSTKVSTKFQNFIKSLDKESEKNNVGSKVASICDMHLRRLIILFIQGIYCLAHEANYAMKILTSLRNSCYIIMLKRVIIPLIRHENIKTIHYTLNQRFNKTYIIYLQSPTCHSLF